MAKRKQQPELTLEEELREDLKRRIHWYTHALAGARLQLAALDARRAQHDEHARRARPVLVAPAPEARASEPGQ